MVLALRRRGLVRFVCCCLVDVNSSELIKIAAVAAFFIDAIKIANAYRLI